MITIQNFIDACVELAARRYNMTHLTKITPAQVNTDLAVSFDGGHRAILSVDDVEIYDLTYADSTNTISAFVYNKTVTDMVRISDPSSGPSASANS